MVGVVCGRAAPLSRVVPVLFTVFPVFELDPVLYIVQSPLCCIPSCCAVHLLFVFAVTALLVCGVSLWQDCVIVE